MNNQMQFVVHLTPILALLLFSLGGCAQLLVEKKHNVELGDIDYPEENPVPKRFVELNIANADLVEYELRTIYGAPKSDECRYLVNAFAGGYSGFNISLPVHVQTIDGTDRAKVIMDKYKPGRCGWQFSALALIVSEGGRQAIGHTILSNPSNTFFGVRQREGLLKDKRTTDKSSVTLECSVSRIEQWHKRGMNGQPCVVNGVWGGVGKVLTDDISEIDVRIRKTESPTPSASDR